MNTTPYARSARAASLLPRGEPRYVRCYDNGGRTADRYTVVFTGRLRSRTGGATPYLGMSENPSSPGGFGQHGESREQIDVNPRGWAPAIGRSCHLGVRIAFRALPEACRKLALRSYAALWGIEGQDGATA